jgi:hypothetical protein
MITISECRLQCNLDETEIEFDRWFAQSIPAAVNLVAMAINRPMYESQAALDADSEALDTAMVITPDLKMAMYMLIGHWFVNRESVTALNLNETPQAFHSIVNAHRLHSI